MNTNANLQGYEVTDEFGNDISLICRIENGRVIDESGNDITSIVHVVETI